MVSSSSSRATSAKFYFLGLTPHCPHAYSTPQTLLLPVPDPTYNVLAAIPAIHHVIDGSFIFDSWLSRHDLESLSHPQSCVNDKD
jgi:hypothetical protein